MGNFGLHWLFRGTCIVLLARRSRRHSTEKVTACRELLYYALVALVIAVVAGAFGFGGIAGTATGLAQLLFYVFLAIFVVVLIMNFMRSGRGPVP